MVTPDSRILNSLVGAPVVLDELQAGRALEPLVKSVTFESITRFSSYAPDAGPDNFHLSREAARRLGFPGVVAQAMMSFGYMTELLVRAFGPRALSEARSTAKFVEPVVEGDTITVGGALERIERDGDRTRVVVATWCRNQRDEVVAIGESQVFL